MGGKCARSRFTLARARVRPKEKRQAGQVDLSFLCLCLPLSVYPLSPFPLALLPRRLLPASFLVPLRDARDYRWLFNICPRARTRQTFAISPSRHNRRARDEKEGDRQERDSSRDNQPCAGWCLSTVERESESVLEEGREGITRRTRCSLLRKYNKRPRDVRECENSRPDITSYPPMSSLKNLRAIYQTPSSRALIHRGGGRRTRGEGEIRRAKAARKILAGR